MKKTLKNIVKGIVKTTNEVIVDLGQIGDVLRLLDLHEINRIDTGSCEWKDSKDKWYVRFSATGRQMDQIESTLKRGGFKEIIILKNTSSWVKVEKLA